MGEDGLLYCGNYHTRKQYRVNSTFLHKEWVVSVLCKCERKQREKEEAARRLLEKQQEIQRMKGPRIHDRVLLEYTFEKDDGTLTQLHKARKYVKTWPERKSHNEGLLLWGGVGTGKTFFAACIANALIEEGVSVLITNFSKILNQMAGLYSEEKNTFVASLM